MPNILKLQEKSCPAVVRLLDPDTGNILWERGPGALPTNYPWNSLHWDPPEATDVRIAAGHVYLLIKWQMLAEGLQRTIWTPRVLDAETGAAVYDHEGDGLEGLNGSLLVDEQTGNFIVRAGGGMGGTSPVNAAWRTYRQWKYTLDADPVTITKTTGQTVDVSPLGAGSIRTWAPPPVCYLGSGLFAERWSNFQENLAGRAARYKIWNFAGSLQFDTASFSYSGLPEQWGTQYLYRGNFLALDLAGNQNFYPIPDAGVTWDQICIGSLSVAELLSSVTTIETTEAAITFEDIEPVEVSEEPGIPDADIFNSYETQTGIITPECPFTPGTYVEPSNLLTTTGGFGRFFIDAKETTDYLRVPAGNGYYLTVSGLPGVTSIEVGGTEIWTQQEIGETGLEPAGGGLYWSPDAAAVRKFWHYPIHSNPRKTSFPTYQHNFAYQAGRFEVGGEYRSDQGLIETAYMVSTSSAVSGYVTDTGCGAQKIYQTPDRNGTTDASIVVTAQGYLNPDRFQPFGYRDEGDHVARGHGLLELGFTLRAGVGYSGEGGSPVDHYRFGFGTIGSHAIQPYRSIQIAGQEIDYDQFALSLPVTIQSGKALHLVDSEFYYFEPDEGADYVPAAVDILDQLQALLPGRTVEVLGNSGAARVRGDRVFWPCLVDDVGHLFVFDHTTDTVEGIFRWKTFAGPSNFRPAAEGLFLVGVSLDAWDGTETYYKPQT